MKKEMIRKYSILAVIVLFVFVLGFGVVRANTGGGVLGQIIEIMKLSNGQSADVSLGAVIDDGMTNDDNYVVVTKTVPYSDITTTGATIVNQVTGDFLVENVVLETGVNTIASGTQIQVVPSGDSYGTSTTVFAADVAAFPKASTMDLNTVINDSSYSSTASSTQRIILEDSSSLLVKCTTADCKTSELETGTGYMKISTVLRKLNNYSSTY